MAKGTVDKQTMRAVKFIVDESKKDLPQIGYDLFVRDFLPILGAPPERGPDGDIVPRDLSAWMSICMHPSNPVQVLNRDGTVRFIVPPLVGTIPTYYAPPRGGIQAIAVRTIEKTALHPVFGQSYLNNALGQSLHDQSNINDSATREWNNVLVEHGYPGLPGYPSEVVEIKAQSADDPAPNKPVAPTRVISDDDYDAL